MESDIGYLGSPSWRVLLGRVPIASEVGVPVHENAEERNDTGVSLELIGGIILFFEFLVLFFLPAGLKLGQQFGFAAILGVVALAAIATVIWGHVVRVRAAREQ